MMSLTAALVASQDPGGTSSGGFGALLASLQSSSRPSNLQASPTQSFLTSAQCPRCQLGCSCSKKIHGHIILL